MNAPVKIVISAAFVCGFSALASSASAMPVSNVGLAPATEEAHAVRVCGRYRCWWTFAGHYHGRYGYGWGRPYYGGYRYGWRGGRYGWHGGRWGWGGHGWRGGWHGGWHGGHGRWR